MATRFYFHNALSTVVGTLPSNEQSTLTPTVTSDAGTVNRSMNTTAGSSQVLKTLSSSATTSLQHQYFTKFVSFPLNTISISANTWTYNIGTRRSDGNSNFPVTLDNQPIRLNCYVWRPSTNAKVGTILDGNSASTVDEPFVSNNTRSNPTTFSGSAVSCQHGDVIVFEVWFSVIQSTATSYTNTIVYDGATVHTSEGDSRTNYASFIQTPQDITEYVPASDIVMNVTATKALTNKFITKT